AKSVATSRDRAPNRMNTSPPRAAYYSEEVIRSWRLVTTLDTWFQLAGVVHRNQLMPHIHEIIAERRYCVDRNNAVSLAADPTRHCRQGTRTTSRPRIPPRLRASSTIHGATVRIDRLHGQPPFQAGRPGMSESTCLSAAAVGVSSTRRPARRGPRRAA